MMMETLPALVLFALVTSVTPGPNNLLLMASGANFGFRRTVPHMLGVSLGFAMMTFLVGAGLTGLFQTHPVATTALEVVSVAYMLWLAWKIAHAAAPKDRQAGGTPMTFLQAAAFQWVNPKAWAMALSAVTLYAPDRSLWTVALVAAIFGAVNLPSVSLWTLTGQQLRRVLTNPRRLTIFNWTMAGLLVLSLAPVLWH
ncbi:MAG: LysE family translocator [Rhodobacter sp.]|nr:LysE family translocator [Rhodobacter sp.]MCA3513184.1 LysE family translocator [Rhodobacter sp.]MCA3521132.1 LysE family translocator [Rhodobacter sp.]MCA3521951.1 LysE family translocator [Rhodobacter sp.]MCA3525017.1 LysE family translocator [Rhodobacter sp.]